MAFDERFLLERVAKQQEWARNGVKCGSGKSFTAISTQSNRFAGGFDIAPSNSGGFGSVSLRGGSKKGSAGGFSLADKAKPIGSPHAIALASLAKNPELRTGGVVKGVKFSANHEHWEQVIYFDWLYRYQSDYYDDFSAVPMGGLRSKKTALSLLAEGAKSGYPDIVADIPLGIYHGLFIELKWGKNKPSEKQIITLRRKTMRGYFAAVCYGHEEAISVTKEYLALPAGGVMAWDKNVELWGDAE